SEPGAAMPQNLRGELARWDETRRQRDERLRYRVSQRIGARHHGRLGHGLVLDQYALELERAHAIIGGLEHVVGAADEGQIAVAVSRRDVARVVGPTPR